MTVQSQATENQAQDVKVDTSQENLVKQRKYYEKQLDEERKARLELEQRLEQVAKQRQISQEDSEDDEDEPYVDHKKLKKQLANFEKNIEQKINQTAEQRAREIVEQEKVHSYLKENADFEKVMSSDVVQKFADNHPRLAENILKMPEGFQRQKLVYETIKAMGLDKPEQKQSSIQEKIEANRRNPYYQPTSVGAPPYASAGDFSDSGRKNAYNKMQELKRNLRI